MKQSPLLRIVLLPCLLLLGACLAFADDISKIHPTGYVTDLAGVISADTTARLEALCTELEQKTGAQMAIVTVNSLDDRSVEDYAVDLYKQLGVGSKKDNRGVLLLVAPHERKYRIEVGYGLEPVINDARAGDAGRAMVPFLRQNDYSKATEVAAWQLANYIAGDAGVTLSGRPPVAHYRDSGGHSGFPVIWAILIVIVFFRLIAGVSGRGGGAGGSGCLWFLLGMMAGGGPGGRSGGSWGGGGGFGGGGGGGFGGFGGGSSGGGGASGSW
jgi:uncharacterized protein